MCRRQRQRTPALCCLLRVAFLSCFKKYNRPHRFLFFFWFSCFFSSLCEHVLRVFVISSFHLRGRRHRSSLTDRSNGINLRARRRRSLLSNIREGGVPRAASPGNPCPGEHRFGAAETENMLYTVCARRDRFADTSYHEPTIALGSHPRPCQSSSGLQIIFARKENWTRLLRSLTVPIRLKKLGIFRRFTRNNRFRLLLFFAKRQARIRIEPSDTKTPLIYYQ